MNTKIIIVAGGKGERLKPITNSIAKPMVTVGGKPVLEHNLDLFKKFGFKNFILALCYLPETIEDYFGDGKKFGVNIEYTYENPETPLGTAGAITLAKDKINSTFIVTYGDSLRVVDLEKMWQQHKETTAFATLYTYKRFGENPKSMIKFDQSNRILEFKERPTPEEITEDFVWANGALYIFEPEIFSYIKVNDQVDFGKDVFPNLLTEKRKVFAFPIGSYFIDIGNKNNLDKAKQDFSKGLIRF